MQHDHIIKIKGMVCDRCVRSIREVLQRLGLAYTHISLGEISTITALSAPDIHLLESELAAIGFSLLEDNRTRLVREVKKLVETVYSGNWEFPDDFRFSTYATTALQRDYATISSTFSALENMTLEKYIMTYRAEKIKELLVYSDAPLSDLAWKLGFSSAAHLAGQFKSVTGLNTSFFRAIRQAKQDTAAT